MKSNTLTKNETQPLTNSGFTLATSASVMPTSLLRSERTPLEPVCLSGGFLGRTTARFRAPFSVGHVGIELVPCPALGDQCSRDGPEQAEFVHGSPVR